MIPRRTLTISNCKWPEIEPVVGLERFLTEPLVFFLLCTLAIGSVWAASGRPAQAQEVAVSSAPAVDPPPVSEESVRSALRRLEADEVAVRDAAELQLIEMGGQVLPLLPDVTPRTSGELKGRLQRIRQALQKQNIEDYFEASKATLQGKFQLGDVIKKLQQQTTNEIQLQGGEGMYTTAIELDHAEADFWKVLRDTMRQANLRINAYGSTDGSLVISPGGGQSSVAPFQTGPFDVEVVSIQTRRMFGTALDGQLDLSFQLTWEPRLKPVFMQIPMSSLRAETTAGDVLVASNPQATLEIPLNLGGCSSQVDLQLQRPARTAATLAKLSGELVIAVPGERHQYIFERFGNGARQSEKYGDVTVTLEGARRNGAVYEIRVLAAFGDAQGALESFRGWILSNQAYLLDKDDKRLENVGLQTYAISNDAVGIAYLFQINGDPDTFRLVYESPAAITRQTIAYELNNIDLP